MVMDATQTPQPSPQSVGREFVRQYYTLMNKAPNHLHRFYNNNSSFIHGESTTVIGQKNIHYRIQQLNLNDCHAKISQVDAQATLGNGVVVQVTGELSNDGQPMRLFTQTFVLAAQSPKKYYVHNDIFRYQDVYSDDENDGDERSDTGEEREPTPIQTGVVNDQHSQQTQIGGVVIPDQQPQLSSQAITGVGGNSSAGGTTNVLQQQVQTGGPQQQAIYYSIPAAGNRHVPVLAPPQTPSVSLGTQYAATPTATGVISSAGIVPPQQQGTSSSAVNQLNGVAGHDDLSGLQQTTVTGVGQAQQTLLSSTGSPAIQNNNSNVPVACLKPVPIAQQQQQQAGVVDSVGIANDVVSNNQNVGIQTFQQSPLIQQGTIIQSQQQHVQQQQHQSHPQQQRLVTQSQQNILQSHVTQNNASIGANLDLEEKINNNTSLSNDVRSSLSGGSPSMGVSAPDTTMRRLHINVQPMQNIDDFKTINEQQQQEKYEAAKQQQQQQNEPKTYANLFKSTPTSPSGFVNAAAMQQQQQTQHHQQYQQQQQQQQQSSNSIFQSSNIASSTYTNQTNNNATNNTSSISTYNRNGGIDGNNGSGPLPQRNNNKFNKDFDRRSSNAQFGDHQQLFLGNIPLHASEDDLKIIFSRFGPIIELRILSKPGSRIPLNYGFITYEDSEAVQKCLASCPIYFPENSPDGQKLNVEEKKPRLRAGDLPSRQGMGNNINNSNMSSNQRNIGGGAGVNSSGNNGPRSLSGGGGNTGGNSGGGMMRGNANNNMQRGASGSSGGGGGGGSGSRLSGGTFNRNENRNNGPANGGGGMRGNNNSQSGGGGTYGRR